MNVVPIKGNTRSAVLSPEDQQLDMTLKRHDAEARVHRAHTVQEALTEINNTKQFHKDLKNGHQELVGLLKSLHTISRNVEYTLTGITKEIRHLQEAVLSVRSFLMHSDSNLTGSSL